MARRYHFVKSLENTKYMFKFQGSLTTNNFKLQILTFQGSWNLSIAQLLNLVFQSFSKFFYFNVCYTMNKSFAKSFVLLLLQCSGSNVQWFQLQPTILKYKFKHFKVLRTLSMSYLKPDIIRSFVLHKE